MKNVSIVILTMVIELALLWGVSVLIHWELMEFLFLGGLLIFAIPWLLLYFTNHNQNVYYANVKGMTGADAGKVKVFRFRFSPIILGLVLFMILSLSFTVFYYHEYFI